MITEILSPLRPDLSAEQLALFETYYAMLADWNTRVNLTAITAPEDVAKKHFLDSLAAAPYLKPNASIVDVGTGAGFPGLPLLIILAAYLHPSTSTVILALSLTGWAFHARIIRAMTMSLREKDYVAASTVAGESNLVIIFRQILPNLRAAYAALVGPTPPPTPPDPAPPLALRASNILTMLK